MSKDTQQKDEFPVDGPQADLRLINLASTMGLAEARKFLAENDEKANKEAAALKEKENAELDERLKAAEHGKTPVTFDPAKRAEEDAAAANFKVAELNEALDALGIKYASNASKADKLALYLARP